MQNQRSIFNTTFIAKNQEIFLPELAEKHIRLVVKREDLVHPFVSGNKFRKLKYNLKAAIQQKQTTVLTFGGAFSNHIVATAVAAQQLGLNSIGVIRGEELSVNLNNTLKNNATLRQAVKHNMQLVFVTRAAYRLKETQDFMANLHQKHGHFYTIPEGGTNALAVKGCEDILNPQDATYNYICCPVGTGGTIAGLCNAAQSHQKVIGFPALKGDFLKQDIAKLTPEKNWTLEAYHFGGYAKYNQTLIHFINDFYSQTGIPLDPVYTGKMLFGILDLVEKDKLPKQSKILAIHTGGLQGITGFNKRLKPNDKQLIT